MSTVVKKGGEKKKKKAISQICPSNWAILETVETKRK